MLINHKIKFEKLFLILLYYLLLYYVNQIKIKNFILIKKFYFNTLIFFLNFRNNKVLNV